jgi:hypothetical protein
VGNITRWAGVNREEMKTGVVGRINTVDHREVLEVDMDPVPSRKDQDRWVVALGDQWVDLVAREISDHRADMAPRVDMVLNTGLRAVTVGLKGDMGNQARDMVRREIWAVDTNKEIGVVPRAQGRTATNQVVLGHMVVLENLKIVDGINTRTGRIMAPTSSGRNGVKGRDHRSMEDMEVRDMAHRSTAAEISLDLADRDHKAVNGAMVDHHRDLAPKVVMAAEVRKVDTEDRKVDMEDPRVATVNQDTAHRAVEVSNANPISRATIPVDHRAVNTDPADRDLDMDHKAETGQKVLIVGAVVNPEADRDLSNGPTRKDSRAVEVMEVNQVARGMNLKENLAVGKNR